LQVCSSTEEKTRERELKNKEAANGCLKSSFSMGTETYSLTRAWPVTNFAQQSEAKRKGNEITYITASCGT
jgi:hypothetical protein